MEFQYLGTTTKILKFVNMWPNDNQSIYTRIKQYLLPILTLITTIPILSDIIIILQEKYLNFKHLNEDFIALSALLGVTYISLCFMRKKDEIRHLVENLQIFEQYIPNTIIEQTENSVKFYTKLFMGYGIIGNICYGVMPYLNYSNCEMNRTDHMNQYGIPCGLVVNFLIPFRTDYSPAKEILSIYEILICIISTVITIIFTMLICGLLIYATTYLKYLEEEILELSNCKDVELMEKVGYCVKFHILIIEHATWTDSCFNQMMLLHVTWTGFVIGLLGFEIIMVTDIVEILRFAMHLAGWLVILFIVCYYGQKLMDQSANLADAIYSTSWYGKSVEFQKCVILILLRSQKALALKASGLKTMSLATFIGVLYSAYSYFTLLLKLKP